jgi:hypothetical protein
MQKMAFRLSRRELVAWVLAIALALTAIVALRQGPADAGVSGPTTQVVYIATGENFPDALGAAAAAAVGLGPVLLVQQDSIPGATLTELNRLQPPTVVIVGGPAVVSAGVEAELVALSYTDDVIRLDGANRYETAAELSAATFPTSGLYPRGARVLVGDLGITEDGVNFLGEAAVIEAPAPGMLFMSGGASFDTTTETIRCGFEVDGIALEPLLRDVAPAAASSCTAALSLYVGAGVHTVDFAVIAEEGVAWGAGTLSVIWIPFDGFGAVPEADL